MPSVIVQRRGAVLNVVLNRPAVLNAANREMIGELAAAAAESFAACAATEEFVEGVRAFLDKRQPDVHVARQS